jgi:hypothetical protein
MLLLAVGVGMQGTKAHGTHAPPPHAIAEALRDQALAQCAAAHWRACRDLLDRAAAEDPAGEAEARVRTARARIEEGTRGEP